MNDKSHWIKREQLDRPLNKIFEGVATDMTPREWAIESERLLGRDIPDLDSFDYVALNEYLDSLGEVLEKAARETYI